MVLLIYCFPKHKIHGREAADRRAFAESARGCLERGGEREKEWVINNHPKQIKSRVGTYKVLSRFRSHVVLVEARTMAGNVARVAMTRCAARGCGFAGNWRHQEGRGGT